MIKVCYHPEFDYIFIITILGLERDEDALVCEVERIIDGELKIHTVLMYNNDSFFKDFVFLGNL
jgi:hypothetical protein